MNLKLMHKRDGSKIVFNCSNLRSSFTPAYRPIRVLTPLSWKRAGHQSLKSPIIGLCSTISRRLWENVFSIFAFMTTSLKPSPDEQGKNTSLLRPSGKM